MASAGRWISCGGVTLQRRQADSPCLDGAQRRSFPHRADSHSGAGVVTTRGLVHYIVTEYGVAYLHGKTIRERAKALIEISHPKFRDELYDTANGQVAASSATTARS